MAIKDISPEAEELLVAYRWPGNIRELRNVIERIVVLENDEIVRPEHLPAEILHRKQRAAEKTVNRADDPRHGVVPGGGGEEPDRPGVGEGRAQQDAGGEAPGDHLRLPAVPGEEVRAGVASSVSQ